MKNILIYYMAILIPLALIFWLAMSGHTNWFAILLLIYAIPYRMLVDGQRLVSKKLIKWNESWKLFFPWNRYDYFKELYFRK